MSETEKKTNGRKVVLLVAILAAVMVILGVAYVKFKPTAVEGSKNIIIEVVDNTGESEMYTVQTDAEYLRQAIEETEGLVIEGEEGAYGLLVRTVNGVTANYDVNRAYWAFYVDGEYCNYGVDEQPIEDGQVYRIVYTAE